MSSKCVSVPLSRSIVAERIEVNSYSVFIPVRKKVNSKISIVQLSDIHINQWNERNLESAVNFINSLFPDFVVLTGDYICKGDNYIPLLQKYLSLISAKHGKIACMGNHDYFDGCSGDNIKNTLGDSGFEILINESRTMFSSSDKIIFAGVDDYIAGNPNLDATFNNISQDDLTILLSHNPTNFTNFARMQPDIILSGHTHAAQINYKPFHLIYKMLYKTDYIAGFYKENQSLLYVNKGLGNTMFGRKIFRSSFEVNTPRFNASPEIAIFDILPDQKNNN